VQRSTDCVTGTEPAAAADADLLRRAQAGDTEAFGELVERHRRAVYRAVYAALRSSAEADDVAQEAFVTAFRRLDTFRGDATFKTWLLSIAWRKALDRRKSVTRWLRMTVSGDPRSDEPQDLVERMPSLAVSQEDRVVGSDLQRTLRRLIAALPPKLRDTLLLAGCGEYTSEEIGRMLGIPVGTVKWRVSEARRLLKQKLQAVGQSHE
jgi:RNA polymerase sigma-70 factor, ECF subfamily